jgi:hypothetical protein
VAGRVVYWIAVVLVSLAILVGLVLFLESRDDSALGWAAGPVPALCEGLCPL